MFFYCPILPSPSMSPWLTALPLTSRVCLAMEEVESMWQKLSLSVEEEAGLEVPNLLGVSKSLLAGKFLTGSIINREVVSRTFKHSDLERVLEYEPWTYDKHLVIFQRIDNATTVSSLAFNECTFWAQIHDLPIKSMTPELGMSIGNSIGKAVCVAESNDDGVIGRYLRVRVALDISKPLSRGRKLKDNGVVVGWVSFRYESLPNFCYWCGCPMHEDRECDIWLKNKAKSFMDKQQFGPWLHAEQERPVRRVSATPGGSAQAGVLSMRPVTEIPVPISTSNGSIGRSA